MKYSGIIKNDLAAAPGVSLSFYVQGCPHRCPGCFNPETWDFEGGKEFTVETIAEILEGLKANGISRSLCILGGEPLCNENAFLTDFVIHHVRARYPETPVYIWSGYTLEELMMSTNHNVKEILKSADYLIDGPYLQEERDLTLRMRGSRNQRIINLKNIRFDF